MYLRFGKVVFRVVGEGWEMWILGEFFCGMGGLECENESSFLCVFARVLLLFSISMPYECNYFFV